MGDANGWRRGAKGIDGNKGSDFLSHRPEYDHEPVRDISGKYGSEFKRACDPWTEDTWKPGPVSKGGPPRYAPKSPGPLKNRDIGDGASPSGKYAKKGGSGQRSGA